VTWWRSLPSFVHDVNRRALIAAVACVGLAAASLLVPSAPTTDPWGWIVWGREVAHLQLETAIGGAPSWKPLPVLFTTPLSVFGGAAPDLWIVVARAGGLLGLYAAFRLASRLAGPGVGTAAGVLAAVGLVLSANWIRTFLHGYAEPFAIAMLLLAIERHWSGRPRQALLLLAGVSLVRPEAFPLALLYGLLFWRRREVPIWVLTLVAVAVPALWLGPDWIGSGDPFHGSKVADAVEPQGGHAALVALWHGLGITPAPLTLGAIAGFVIAYRAGDRRVVELSLLALGLAALMLGLMLAGYPAEQRFFVLPQALICVVGSVGVVRVVELVTTTAARVGVAAVIALAALPLLTVRTVATGDETRDSVRRARVESSLATAISRAGPARLRDCGVPILPRGLGWMRGNVAWQLHLSLRRIHSVATSAGDYLETLSHDGVASAPREVTITTRRRHMVLIAPFSRSRVQFVRTKVDWATAIREGEWQLIVPDSSVCMGRPATRPA
jgi:hypothetical protein